MDRYRCVKCGTEWFTSSLREGTMCGRCQGELEEYPMHFSSLTDCSRTLNKEDDDK
jgi:predicted Zn-ribbon and HTH transcriptional regulator